MATRRGAYPGSFNPPTVAHLAIAEAARHQCRLDRVELVVSTAPLGKLDDPSLASLDERVANLEAVAAGHEWLVVTVTAAQLLADIAQGYDVLVLGADKWNQVVDTSWYGSDVARDEALARLPHVAIAPRPPHDVPAPDARTTILTISPDHHVVSATAVREGRHEWLAPGTPTT
jgi:nicotinic acid mononucleotide adenylyltransferase